MAVTIKSCAFIQPKDVNLGAEDGNKLAEKLDVCVGRATLALKQPAIGYTDLQRDNISFKFGCMKATFRHVRRILSGGFEEPCTVDALAIARLTLEDLYSLCLMFESPRHVSDYLQDGWRKAYVQLLLQAEETRNLNRFDDYTMSAPKNLNALRLLLGITDAQVLGVHWDELGVPMRSGVIYESIPRFPTPAGVIKLIPDGDKRAMLKRLYMEYVYLCSFTHGLSEAVLFKTMFNGRSPIPHQFTEAQRLDTWRRAVEHRAFITSLLSVVQATAELTKLYPQDANLFGAAMDAWKVIADGTLLGQAIWNIRTRRLLGVLGV